MAPVCDLCLDADSKYKCPVCNVRYCSIACYKPHKATHDAAATQQASLREPQPLNPVKVDRPGTTQRVAKQSFNGLEHDPEFRRLLSRYPTLEIQLQGIYALTLDPGPEEARSWNKIHLPMLDRPRTESSRGARGRGRGGRALRGGRPAINDFPDGREHGQWSREKGDREALHVIKGVQTDISDETLADGLQEFVELVRMKFGDRQQGS